MSTLGHPLSDLANLLTPFLYALHPLPALSTFTNPAFSASTLTPGLPSRFQCVSWYAEAAGWDPRSELQWGELFGVFRNSVIMQGIAARIALRQATSQKAMEYGGKMKVFGEFAWGLKATVEGTDAEAKAKL